MFVIIGVVMVLGSLILGFLLSGGNLILLAQINEFIIIGGAAIGSTLIANPLPVIKKIIAGALGTLKGAKVNKVAYVELMQMLYEIFQFAKREGLIALESHVENPSQSSIMSKYPTFLANHHAVDFFVRHIKSCFKWRCACSRSRRTNGNRP